MSYNSGYRAPYKPRFFIDPEDNLMDALEIRGTRFDEVTMQVMVYGRNSRLLRVYQFLDGDEAKAKYVRDIFNHIAIACQFGEFSEPDWDHPAPRASPKVKILAV